MIKPSLGRECPFPDPLFWLDALDYMRSWVGPRSVAALQLHDWMLSDDLPYALRCRTQNGHWIYKKPGREYLEKIVTAEFLAGIVDPSRIRQVWVLAPNVPSAADIVRARRAKVPIPNAVVEDPAVVCCLFVRRLRLEELRRRVLSTPASVNTPNDSPFNDEPVAAAPQARPRRAASAGLWRVGEMSIAGDCKAWKTRARHQLCRKRCSAAMP
jgi:hypothetical protein